MTNDCPCGMDSNLLSESRRSLLGRHVEDVHFWGFGAPALFWPPPLLRPWAEEGSDGSKHASACWSVTNANKRAWTAKDFKQLLAALPFKDGCFYRDRK